MNFVTTQHSSSKLGSVFAAPKFSDLLFTIYLDILLFCHFSPGRKQDGIEKMILFDNMGIA